MKDQALCNLLPRFKGPVGHMEVCRQAAERIAVLSPEMNPKLESPQASTDTYDVMRKIGHEIATQDNRITDAPIFIVQQKRSYVGHPDYNECRVEWRQDDHEPLIASRTYARELETYYRHTGEEKKGWIRLAVFDVWEFVTACFTEQGCKDYLAINAHNLNEPRIYAEGSYRNHEYRTVRNYLIGLADKPADKDF